jgi:N-acetylglucosaminyldiphosphoundecaprenol N-acetyl-beta-D-mannosaminyltransferase
MKPQQTQRRVGRVLDSAIDVVGWHDATERLLGWARLRESRYVAICNAHLVVTASKDHGYQQVINQADMATPDGAPVAWMLRRQGYPGQPRVNGPDLMWALCERCAAEKLPVYFYGSTNSTLKALDDRLRQIFPDLVIAGLESPPFRQLALEEDAQAVQRINTSGAAIVFVGLGCPKQERWMADHRGRVSAVMIGVGAAFDYHAGTLKRAPMWMQNNGLEWLYRLVKEPKRLWKRYLVTNTQFVVAAAHQLLTFRGS